VVTQRTDNERTRRAVEAVERRERAERDREREERILDALERMDARVKAGEAVEVTPGTPDATIFSDLADLVEWYSARDEHPKSSHIDGVHEFPDGYSSSKAKRTWMYKHNREMSRLDQLRNLIMQAAKDSRFIKWRARRGHYYGALALPASFLCRLWKVSRPTAMNTIRFLLRNGYCVKRKRQMYESGGAVGRPLGAVYLFGRRTVVGGPVVPQWSWIEPKAKVVPERNED